MPIDLRQYKHKIILVQLLFILCKFFCNNDQMTFCMYNLLYTFGKSNTLASLFSIIMHNYKILFLLFLFSQINDSTK